MNSPYSRYKPRKPGEPAPNREYICTTCGKEHGDYTDHEIAERPCAECMAPKQGQRQSATDVLIPGHGYVSVEEAKAIAAAASGAPEVGGAAEATDTTQEDEDEGGGLGDA